MQNLFEAIEASRHGIKGFIITGIFFLVQKFYAAIGLITLSSFASWATIISAFIASSYTTYLWITNIKDRRKRNKRK